MERWKDKIIDFCEVTNLGGDVCVRVLASERCGFFLLCWLECGANDVIIYLFVNCFLYLVVLR